MILGLAFRLALLFPELIGASPDAFLSLAFIVAIVHCHNLPLSLRERLRPRPSSRLSENALAS
jgi:hypothetical protein